jgi:hypothetical protein
MMWSEKKDPMRDGSVPVYICRDPDLHREWKARVFVFALFAFGAGAFAQWLFHLLP